MTRHLHEELILQILGDLRVLQAVLVSHCLKQGQLVLLVKLKLCLVRIKESTSLDVKLFQHHVKVEADEDGEEDSDQLRLALIERLINKCFEFLIALAVVVGVTP